MNQGQTGRERTQSDVIIIANSQAGRKTKQNTIEKTRELLKTKLKIMLGSAFARLKGLDNDYDGETVETCSTGYDGVTVYP